MGSQGLKNIVPFIDGSLQLVMIMDVWNTLGLNPGKMCICTQ